MNVAPTLCGQLLPRGGWAERTARSPWGFCNWHWVPSALLNVCHPPKRRAHAELSRPTPPGSPNPQVCFAKAKTLGVSSKPAENHSLLSVSATKQTHSCAGNLFAAPICNHIKSSRQTHEPTFFQGEIHHLPQNPEMLLCLDDTS